MKKKEEENKKSFDKIEYIKQFNKENYRRITSVFTKDEAAAVEEAAQAAGQSKSAFIKACVLDTIKLNDEK